MTVGQFEAIAKKEGLSLKEATVSEYTRYDGLYSLVLTRISQDSAAPTVKYIREYIIYSSEFTFIYQHLICKAILSVTLSVHKYNNFVYRRMIHIFQP